MNATHAEPWERQPGETPEAWEAFRHYRDGGVTRSLRTVAEQLQKSQALMGRWSARHSWVLRASAYDNEQDRLWRLELQVQRRKSARRNLAVAQGTMQVVSQAVVQMVQNPGALTPGDVARLMETASKLERLVLGEPTERTSVTAGPGGADSADVGVLSDEERRTRMEMLRRELNSRLGEEASA